ncbi:F510_1955 family glycosylhydrolase [Neobacillus sp. K501]
MKSHTKILTIFIGLLIILSGCSNEKQNKKEPEQESSFDKTVDFEMVEEKKLKVEQIRGIGYPGNDNALYIASDDGLRLFKDNLWYKTTTNKHDFLGFQAVSEGFIASGKPQKGTGLKDPLGIVQSKDKGETLQKLAFYGENSFYFMGASFNGDGIYVINQEANDDLALGVNYSTDNGETWKSSELEGFQADSLGMLAVHPENDDIIAMSTRSGIYYSEDSANTMKLITGTNMVTGLTFTGDEILFSSVENENILLKKMNPLTGEEINFTIPFLDYQNPITYIAVNPKNPLQMAFTTYNNDLYESLDGGNQWKNQLLNGKTELE